MVRAGGAVQEVPLAQRPLLTLDDGEPLAGKYEEVLLMVSQWYIDIGSPGSST
jgi:hypothetical protein